MEGSQTRVLIEDSRGAGRHLRVSWHPAASTIVFSHWTGDVCTASTPVKLTDAAKVIGLLVGALADAASASVEVTKSSRPGAGLRHRLIGLLRPRVAEIVDATARFRAGQGSATGKAERPD